MDTAPPSTGRNVTLRRALLALLAVGTVVALFFVGMALSDGGTDSASGPASPTRTATLPAATATGGASPSATTASAGLDYGYIRSMAAASSSYEITYDKADYLHAACDARTNPDDHLDEVRADRICFSNVNPRLRTVPLAPDVRITRDREGDPPVQITPAELATYLPTDEGGPSHRYRTWKIVVRAGVVTQLTQFSVSGA